MVLLREKGTTADCLQIMAYSINCHAILLLQMVRLYITPLCIYRDPAYPLRVHLQGSFKGDALTPLEQHLSQVRVAVERVFGDITNYFAYLD